MSLAIGAQGIVIERGNGANPEVFTAIGEITRFDGPNGSASIIDVTHLGSTAKEKRPGLQDNGQVTFDMNLVPGDVGQIGLRDDRASRVERSFRIVLTDEANTALAFAGFVTGFSISGGVDDKVAASAVVEVTGDVVWS